MAGTLFVVCVPTKEHEAGLMKQEPRNGLQSVNSVGNLQNASPNPRLSNRSKSEDSLFTNGYETPGARRREMFIGPWRVDATDLPTLPLFTPGRSPRSPLSRSVPEGISANHLQTPLVRKQRNRRSLEMELETVLEELKITNAVWCIGRSNRFYQVLFSIDSGEHCEEVLKKLADKGIGLLLSSVVSVLPCVLYYQGSEKSGADSPENLKNDVCTKNETECGDFLEASGSAGKPQNEQGVWERFVQSVRARLTVAQVVEGVHTNAIFTFDFLLLLIVAAFTAAIGLYEDSTVILVASMLISPLMGPVMAATFGTMIHDRHLQHLGFINECAGLLLCLVIGFIVGIGVGFLDQPCPTREMLDRGQVHSLWINVLIAVLSGAGISIALLRDNIGSLVGVAISASLLPPAVNAGLLWGLSLVYYILDPDLLEPVLHYTTYYSDEPDLEMAVMGGISLCITFINIVFIYLTGILMLKVKEVAPNSQAHQRFWKHDVKIARDYNTTLYGASAAEIRHSLVTHDHHDSECVQGEKLVGQNLPPELARLMHVSSGLQDSPHFGTGGAGGGDTGIYLGMCPDPHHQLTWSPSSFEHPSAVRELEGIYRTIRQQQRQTGHVAPEKAGPGPTRLPWASNYALPTMAPAAYSWRLGSSDGFRCSLHQSRSPPAGKLHGVSVEDPVEDLVRGLGPASVHVTSTLPIENLSRKSLIVPDQPLDGSQSRRSLGLERSTNSTALSSKVETPIFRTPTIDTSRLSPTKTPASSFWTPGQDEPGAMRRNATSTVVSVCDETGSSEAPTAPKFAKKKRFVVTKADDSEALLPREETLVWQSEGLV